MGGPRACGLCMRRSWLLGLLSVRLNFRCSDETRLLELLELEDDDLIDAIAGRRRREIRRAWKRFGAGTTGASDGPRVSGHARPDGHGQTAAPDAASRGGGRPDALGQTAAGRAAAGGARIETICRHSPRYPGVLRGWPGAPQMLYVRGGVERLAKLASGPTVAIVGGAEPTDYGMEMAASLARDLSACGVTIVSMLAGGIASAALTGVRERDGRALAVLAGGLDAAPACRRRVCEQLADRGCAIAELECGQKRHHWSAVAGARTVAGLARLTIVVEAGAQRSELRCARIANGLGRTVAAMPGRVTSPASVGTNLMLRDGAPLVRDAADALELLSGLGTRARGGWTPANGGGDAPTTVRANGSEHTGGAGGEVCPQSLSRARTGRAGETARGSAELEPRLKAVLDGVGAGRDTPGKLTEPGADAGEIMLALAELEVMGMLGRGDGGRYVPRVSLAAAAA